MTGKLNESGGGSLSAGFLAGLADDAVHRLRRLRTIFDPVIHTIELDGKVLTLLLGIVGTDEFNKAAVARAALVSHRNAVKWYVF